jgi:hypothetical protein
VRSTQPTRPHSPASAALQGGRAPEDEAVLIAEPVQHPDQVRHEVRLALAAQVAPEWQHRAAGAPGRGHPERRRVGEGLEDARAARARRQQHPDLPRVGVPVPLAVGTPEAARAGCRSSQQHGALSLLP